LYIKLKPKLRWLPVVMAVVVFLIIGLPGCNKTTESTLTQEVSNNRIILATTRVAVSGMAEALKGVTGDSQRSEFIRKYVAPIRFYDDDSGYFFVYDYTCKNIAIAVFSELQGKDLIDYQDSHGKYPIREMAAAAKKGGGFVEYYWPHPLTKADMRKISYVKSIPGTEYSWVQVITLKLLHNNLVDGIGIVQWALA
jgi:signal transduction histidine kinase